MARKAYSDEEREQVKKDLMATMIRCIADRGLIHSSIDVVCREVGISKTFFYSFFSSKEELVLHALRYQQPQLLDHARSLMEDPGLSWRAGVEIFLKNCCYQKWSRCPVHRGGAAGTPLPFRGEFPGLPTGSGRFLWEAAFHFWPPCGQH